MKITPTLEDVRRIAESGRYNVLPVSCELLSDFTTPIETMRILKNVSTHCYMLESAQANETWGRYTFLGFDPPMEITCMNGELKAGNIRIRTDRPSDYLRQLLAGYRSPRFEELPPFTGGLVGYFSYNYLGYSEPAVRCQVKDTEDFRGVDVMLFDKVIAFDNLRQKIVLIVNMPLDDVEVGYNKAVMELKHLAELLRHGEKKSEPGGRLLGEVTPLFDKEQFCGMVEKAKHYIREGDIFQIVLSNRLSAPFAGSLLNTYRVLRTINVLLDSGAGTGTAFDWALIRDIGRPYFLAGGLDACSVGSAIRRLHPFAVDVSSGIETDGHKDVEKMAAFVGAVRKEERA